MFVIIPSLNNPRALLFNLSLSHLVVLDETSNLNCDGGHNFLGLYFHILKECFKFSLYCMIFIIYFFERHFFSG